eukprot:3537946-Pyramimonas_sp.AAC.1
MNELADDLAKQLAKDPSGWSSPFPQAWTDMLGPRDSRGWEWLHECCIADRIAYPNIEHHDFQDFIPDPNPKPEHMDLEDITSEIKAEGLLNIATINVQSMGIAKKSKDKGLRAGEKQRVLLEYFQQHRLHLVGVQETRHKIGARNVGEYHVISSPADKGNFGCEIWLNTQLPYGTSKRGPLLFTSKHVTLLQALPRLLVARIQAPGMHMVVASAHAPHSRRPAAEKKAFWSMLKAAISRWKIQLTFLDGNARLGSIETKWVGAVAPQQEDDNGR